MRYQSIYHFILFLTRIYTRCLHCKQKQPISPNDMVKRDSSKNDDKISHLTIHHLISFYQNNNNKNFLLTNHIIKIMMMRWLMMVGEMMRFLLPPFSSVSLSVSSLSLSHSSILWDDFWWSIFLYKRDEIKWDQPSSTIITIISHLTFYLILYWNMVDLTNDIFPLTCLFYMMRNEIKWDHEMVSWWDERDGWSFLSLSLTWSFFLLFCDHLS